MTINFIFVFWPSPIWHNALITRKNTRIGATPFKAPTNKLPKMEIAVACGITKPRIIPIISPQIILLTRLMLFHVFHTFFMFTYLSLQMKISAIPL